MKSALRTRLHRWLAIGGLLVASTGAPGAQAQIALPCKQLTIIAPFSPGDSADLFARALAKELGERAKIAAVVENRTGAGSTIGIASVAKAPADGCTLVVVSSSFTTTAAVQPSLPYDALKSFAPVAKLATGTLVMVVRNDFPARTPTELVEQLKANPGKFAYASTGIATVVHFVTEMFLATSGAKATHVPYRGVGPAIADLTGGRVDLMMAGLPTLMAQIESGRLRAVGVTSPQPSAFLPSLPTLASAVPGYEASAWWGLLAPAGTPDAVVEALNKEINTLLTLPDMRALFTRLGVEPAPSTPRDFARSIADELARWRDVARQSAIKLD